MAVLALLLLVSLTSSVYALHRESTESLQVEELNVGLFLEEVIMLRKELEEVKVRQKDTERLELQVKETEERLQLQERRTKALETKMEPRHETEENQILFSVVTHENFGPVTVDTNIPFPEVYANVGGGWQSQLNAFFVNKDGYYLFFASMAGTSTTDVYVHIAHTTPSGTTRVASMRSPNSTGDANMAIIYAEFGDFVSVQLSPSGESFSGSTYIYTTFSGFFLFP